MQLAKRREVGTLWIPVRNSLTLVAKAEGEGLTKLSLHLRTELADLLERYAAVENEVQRLRIKASGKDAVEPARSWTRKSLAEELLTAQVEDLEEDLAAQIRVVGSLPKANDKEAVADYAARVLAWSSKKRV